jgi:FkbM family methyltransferase
VRLSRAMWSAPVVGRFLRSVAYRYASQLSKSDNPFRSVTVHGVQMTAHVGSLAFTGIYFGSVPYEAELTRYLVEHLAPGDVFVDAGANGGYFTLLASGVTGPSGRAFAFEPNPPVFRELADHIARNALGDRVRTFELGLSDRRSEDASLFVHRDHSGFSTLLSEADIPAQYVDLYTPVRVRTITFDRWRELESVDRVDVMKIDVEGFEAQVLAGMVESLRARRIGRLVCETSWDSPAHRLLVQHGFRPTILESVGSLSNIAYEL